VVRSRARVRLIFATDTEVEAWIDALEAGDVERVTNRRTWAEVTADGAFLRGLPSA
jgi:predicted nucleic acid-binding protein